MLSHFRALGIAGLTTLSASQLALAGPDSVLWSHNRAKAEPFPVSRWPPAPSADPTRSFPWCGLPNHEVGGTALGPVVAV